MFLFLKGWFTRRQRDAAIIAVAMLAAWQFPLVGIVAGSIFALSFLILEIIYYTMSPKGKPKEHIWTEASRLWTSTWVTVPFRQKARANTLSIIEAKWLLAPGLFTKAADLTPSSFYPSALYSAAVWGNLELATLLIAKGASKTIQEGSYKNTALETAVLNNQANVIPLLTPGGKQLKALKIAAKNGVDSVFEALIKAGAMEGCTPDEKFQILATAIRHKNPNILRAYHKAVQDLFIPQNEWSIFHAAAHWGCEHSMKYLLEIAPTHPQIQVKSQGNFTAMDIAAFFKNEACIKLLAAKGYALSDPSTLDQEKLRAQMCKDLDICHPTYSPDQSPKVINQLGASNPAVTPGFAAAQNSVPCATQPIALENMQPKTAHGPG
jgi:ankyrin repeat protein